MKTKKTLGKKYLGTLRGGDGIDGESGPVQRHSACRVIKEHESPGLLTDLRGGGGLGWEIGPLSPGESRMVRVSTGPILPEWIG